MTNNYEYRHNCLQYFRIKPTKDILKKILKCFNLTEICYHTKLSTIHCNIELVLSNFKKIKPELEIYYRPCRLKVIFEKTPLTFQNCITILKNVLTFFNHSIRCRQYKFRNLEKYTYYQIENNDDFTEERKMIPIKINRSKAIYVDFK